MAKQESSLQNISAKTKEAASAAGEAVGQAAINVTHLALEQARAVVASADQMMRRSKPGAKIRRVKGRAKRRLGASKKAARKMVRKARRASPVPARRRRRRTAK
jgi:hypothetical protein